MMEHLISLKIRNMMDINVELLQWFVIALIKKSASFARSETSATQNKSISGSGIKNENISNKELGEKLHKPIIRKFKKRKKYSSFVDNIWGADLANMQLISTFIKEICFYFMLGTIH